MDKVETVTKIYLKLPESLNPTTRHDISEINLCSAKNSGVIPLEQLIAGVSSQSAGSSLEPLQRNFATYLPKISACF